MQAPKLRRFGPILACGVVLVAAMFLVVLSARPDVVPVGPGRHVFAGGRVSLELPAGGVDTTESWREDSTGRSLIDRLFGPEPNYPGFRTVALESLGFVMSTTGPAEPARQLLELGPAGVGEPEAVAIPGAAEAYLVEIEGATGDGVGVRLFVFDGHDAHEIQVHYGAASSESEDLNDARAAARALLKSARFEALSTPLAPGP